MSQTEKKDPVLNKIVYVLRHCSNLQFNYPSHSSMQFHKINNYKKDKRLRLVKVFGDWFGMNLFYAFV